MRSHFDAVAPDVLWCGEMTEIGTGEGKVYLATVIDMFSRRMLGIWDAGFRPVERNTRYDTAMTSGRS